MDEEIDRLVLAVRADTSGFARDVTTMKTSLEQGVGSGADRAARAIEAALARAVRSGKLGFDDLGAVVLKVMGEIASAAIRAGIGSVTGTGGSGGSGGSGATSLIGAATHIVGAALGLPGRATGGPVSPGAAYLVGERGPEVFVPTASGTVLPTPRPAAPAQRDVRVSITIGAPGGSAPDALARSSRQVARAVTRALAQAEG